MRQLVQDLRSGSVTVMEVPDPAPRPDHVVVRNAWSVISPGTEQSITRAAGRSLAGKALERPDQVRKVVDKALSDGVGAALAAVNARLDDLMTPGYSSAGVVEAVGEGVAGLRVGDRVACVGANVACHAERVLVPAPLCVPLPDGLDARWGAFAALGAIAGHGLRTAEVEAGAVVVVLGLGLIGQIAKQLAAAAGARVVAIDLDPRRVELALGHGASSGAVLGADDVLETVLARSGGAGADAVLITAATDDSAPVELAAELARDRGIVSVVGDVGMDVPRRPFYAKELQLRLSRSYGPGRYDADYELRGRDYPIGYVRWTQRRLIAHFLEEVTLGRVRLDELVSHEFALEDGAEAYGALAEPGRMAILLRHPGGDLPATPRIAVAAPAAGDTGAIRLGLVGPGLFARSTLLPLIEKLDARLVAVAGGSGPRAVGVARRAQALIATASPADLLTDPGVDALVVATRHDSHAQLAAGALAAGKAVFLEKPLAIDAAGLEQVRTALEAGGRLMVDFNRSLAPATDKVRAYFAGRADPLSLQVRINAGTLPEDHWLRDPEVGGGRLVGEGCHFVDLCSTIVGAPLAWISATPLGRGPSTADLDSFALTLSYADGSVAQLSYVATGSRRMPKERVEVLGAGRSAMIDDFRRVTLFGRRGRPALPVGVTKDKGHEGALTRFLAFARIGGEPPVPYERLLETTRATLIAREALVSAPGAPQPVGS